MSGTLMHSAVKKIFVIYKAECSRFIKPANGRLQSEWCYMQVLVSVPNYLTACAWFMRQKKNPWKLITQRKFTHRLCLIHNKKILNRSILKLTFCYFTLLMILKNIQSKHELHTNLTAIYDRRQNCYIFMS